MEPGLVGALSAVMGSIVGGSASIATAWITQRTQSRREFIRTEVRKREALYAEFIAEAARVAVDSLDHTLDHPATMMQCYALLNRMRLLSSAPVVDAAESVIRSIVAQYFDRNLSIEEIRALDGASSMDPLRPFSQACRDELNGLLGR